MGEQHRGEVCVSATERRGREEKKMAGKERDEEERVRETMGSRWHTLQSYESHMDMLGRAGRVCSSAAPVVGRGPHHPRRWPVAVFCYIERCGSLAMIRYMNV